MRDAKALKLEWHQWNPGLDIEELSLGEVLSSLPGASAVEIPWIIRLLENPSSRLALPGAITLARHDAIHVLLGRGLTVQDEAFVIGFTMGASKKLTNWQQNIFMFASLYLYPKPFNFTREDLIVYDLGVKEGQHQKATALEDFPFEDHMDRPVADLRRELGINPVRLRSIYRWERKLLPHRKTSRRIDVDVGGVDATDITPLEAPASDWKKERVPRKSS